MPRNRTGRRTSGTRSRLCEGPDYVFCLCCQKGATGDVVGHKDVVQREVREAMRRDKLRSHVNPAHVRAMAMYENKYGSMTEPQSGASSQQLPAASPTQTPPIEPVDPPLAALVRTAVVTALSKSALRLVGSTWGRLPAARQRPFHPRVQCQAGDVGLTSFCMRRQSC